MSLGNNENFVYGNLVIILITGHIGLKRKWNWFELYCECDCYN